MEKEVTPSSLVEVFLKYSAILMVFALVSLKVTKKEKKEGLNESLVAQFETELVPSEL